MSDGGSSAPASGRELQLACGLVLKNRLCKAAMTEGLADSLSRATRALATLYERWASGGTGLLISGNVQVDRRYMERAGNVAIEGPQSPEAMALLRAWATAGRKDGAHLILQLSHAGRQSSKQVNLALVGPSDVALEDPNPESARLPSTTRALTLSEIADVRQRFVHAARVTKEAGFSGCQLHAAHGYLLSSFLSPKANQRTDAYGGTLENRARLLLEIVKEISALRGPDFLTSVKINSADFQRGGFTAAEFEEVVRMLDPLVDIIEVSGGNAESPAMLFTKPGASPAGSRHAKAAGVTVNASTLAREAYFLTFASRVKDDVKHASLMVTGGFRSRAAIDDAVGAGRCDLVGIGRPLCVDPECSGKILQGSITALPRVEDLPLPIWLRPLYLFSLGPKAEFFGQQSHCYRAILALSEGKPVPEYSFLKGVQENRAHDLRCALELEGVEAVGQVTNKGKTLESLEH
jgi:2,4-dienoyl-CoA reductase-like NADH-dependent reductase (Old Yellow Enzyme family)